MSVKTIETMKNAKELEVVRKEVSRKKDKRHAKDQASSSKFLYRLQGITQCSQVKIKTEDPKYKKVFKIC